MTGGILHVTNFRTMEVTQNEWWLLVTMYNGEFHRGLRFNLTSSKWVRFQWLGHLDYCKMIDRGSMFSSYRVYHNLETQASWAEHSRLFVRCSPGLWKNRFQKESEFSLSEWIYEMGTVQSQNYAELSTTLLVVEKNCSRISLNPNILSNYRVRAASTLTL